MREYQKIFPHEKNSRRSKMKCSNCGHDFDINQGSFCPKCGYKNNTVEQNNKNNIGMDTVNYPPHCGGTASVRPAFPMKWYKFLKVMLWISLLLNLGSAFNYFMGTNYTEFKDNLFAEIPLWRYVDIFAGIFSIAMSVYLFIVWRSLHNYKADSLMLLIISYILNIIFLLAYIIALTLIVENAGTTMIYSKSYVPGGYVYYLDLNAYLSSLGKTIGIQIGSSILAIIINYDYFKKRAFMFIN